MHSTRFEATDRRPERGRGGCGRSRQQSARATCGAVVLSLFFFFWGPSFQRRHGVFKLREEERKDQWMSAKAFVAVM